MNRQAYVNRRNNNIPCLQCYCFCCTLSSWPPAKHIVGISMLVCTSGMVSPEKSQTLVLIYVGAYSLAHLIKMCSCLYCKYVLFFVIYIVCTYVI